MIKTMIKTIENLLEKVFTDIKPYYIGIFVKEKVIASRYIEKSEKLEKNLSKMIEYSTKAENAIKNFKPEFLFSSGKDFSIMIYYATNNITIGIINIGKPNLPLLKITAQDLAENLKKYEKELLLYYEEHLNTTKITEKTIKEEKTEKTNITIPSLEEILLAEIQNTSAFTNDIPKQSKNDIPDIDNILNEIEKEFIKIIGPFGKYLFKNKKSKLLKDSSITKSAISELIQSLTEEIPENEKKELFLKNINDLLIFIL